MRFSIPQLNQATHITFKFLKRLELFFTEVKWWLHRDLNLGPHHYE